MNSYSNSNRTMTLDPKEGVPVGGPPMPDHWRIDELTRFPRLKTTLLYIGVGRSTAEECWERSYHGPAYEEGRDQLRERVAHMNVVVSPGLCEQVYELLADS